MRHLLRLASPLLTGVAAGFVARLLFSVLPADWATLANTSALWGLLPFAIGALLSGSQAGGWKTSALRGVMGMLGMIAAWTLSSPTPIPVREVAVFLAVGLLAGATCAVAGTVATGAQRWPRRAGLAFVGGLLVGEAFYGLVLIGGPQWWLELAIGLAIPLAFGRSSADRLIAAAGSGVLAVALFAVFALYDRII